MTRARSAWRLFESAIVVGTLWVEGCSHRVEPSRGIRDWPEPPGRSVSSLLIVTLDTFRGDFFGAGGDPLTRTPHLDRLARTGSQFEWGISGSPVTLPSHASMFTGLDASGHGVRDNGFFRVADDIPTLAEGLRERGFRTGATIAAFPLEERFGLARGFESYDDDVGEAGGRSGLVMAQRAGKQVIERFLPWLHTIDAHTRLFGWVHFYDAHQPNDAPNELIRASGNDPYRAELAETDSFLGQVVRDAQARSPIPWILVLADHGESRDDHGEGTHGIFVYDSTLRIPAVVWPAPNPKFRGLHRAMFRTHDVPATCFGLLGFDASDAPGNGVDAFTSGATSSYFETYYPFFHFGWSPLRGIQDTAWKYIDAPEPELFDLEHDPGERHNVVRENPDVERRMRPELERIVAAAREGEPYRPQPEAVEALESLGYVMSRLDARPIEEGLPDPKRRIATHQFLATAQMLLTSSRYEEALVPLRAAIARDPANKETQLFLGLAFAGMGRHHEAIDAFLRCVSLPPHISDRVPRFELATSYLRLDRPSEARFQLEKILAEDPTDTASWYNLGVAHEMEKDFDSARRAWETALRSDPAYELARQGLDRIRPSRRD